MSPVTIGSIFQDSKLGSGKTLGLEVLDEDRVLTFLPGGERSQRSDPRKSHSKSASRSASPIF